MKNLVAVICLSLIIGAIANAQTSVINLRFDLTGGQEDELKEGVTYTLEDLMEIKGPEAIETESSQLPIPPYLLCVPPNNNNCIVQCIICGLGVPITISYSLDFTPNGCGGLFDGLINDGLESLLCNRYFQSDVPVSGLFTTTCENESNCVTLFGYGTGPDFCAAQCQLSFELTGVECVPSSESGLEICSLPVPALSQWGLILLGLGLVIFGTLFAIKRIPTGRLLF